MLCRLCGWRCRDAVGRASWCAQGLDNPELHQRPCLHARTDPKSRRIRTHAHQGRYDNGFLPAPLGPIITLKLPGRLQLIGVSALARRPLTLTRLRCMAGPPIDSLTLATSSLSGWLHCAVAPLERWPPRVTLRTCCPLRARILIHELSVQDQPLMMRQHSHQPTPRAAELIRGDVIGAVMSECSPWAKWRQRFGARGQPLEGRVHMVARPSGGAYLHAWRNCLAGGADRTGGIWATFAFTSRGWWTWLVLHGLSAGMPGRRGSRGARSG